MQKQKRLRLWFKLQFLVIFETRKPSQKLFLMSNFERVQNASETVKISSRNHHWVIDDEKKLLYEKEHLNDSKNVFEICSSLGATYAESEMRLRVLTKRKRS